MTAPATARRRCGVAGRCCLLVVLLILACGSVEATAAPLPPQGVYDSCSPGTTAAEVKVCVEGLGKVRGAGFVIMLNYSALYGSPEQVRAYARAAHELGVRLIWPLHHPDLHTQPDVATTFRAMTTACGCSSPREVIPFMVGVVKDSPATFMYYVGDETPLERHAGMAANSRLIATSDPTHARFYVTMADFGANLTPFADDADVLGGDPYPIGGSNRLEDVADASRAVQSIADAHGRPSAIVLQAFSWGPFYDHHRTERWPTVAEYRTMRDLALANGRPQFILWWAAYVIARSSEPERHWAELVEGAMGPSPADPEPPAHTPAPPDPSPAQPAADVPAGAPLRPARPEVRELSATRRRRVVRVRFALTSGADTVVTARSGQRRVRRRLRGRVSPRTVALRLARGMRRVVAVRVTPSGGRSVRVRVPGPGGEPTPPAG